MKGEMMTKKSVGVPKVLLQIKKIITTHNQANWGKGSGGPYPWRKK